MENQDLDEFNKKIKEQFDKITKDFNNLFEIKKVSEEIETSDVKQKAQEADAKSGDLTKIDISKNFEGEWNNFISGIQNGFGVLKKSTEEQSKSFLEQSEENKNKFNQFFKNLKNKWDTQINTWQDEFKHKQEKTKLDWENKLQRIKGDYEKWREQQKQEFKEGMREFSRATIKGAYQFLLFMIPILVVVIVLVWVLSYVLPQ